MTNDARLMLRNAGFRLHADWGARFMDQLLSDDRGISVGVMYPGDHVADGVPLIKVADLFGNRINPRPEFRISHGKHAEYRRTELEGGELLMTLVGDVGRCAVVPDHMRGWNAARAVAVMRFREPRDAYFVRACLLSRELRVLMDAWSNTTVQQTLNLKEIRRLPLPWPDDRTRQSIATLVRSLDDNIELNRWMNETLEAMARALFKSWFIDFDPVRAKMAGRAPAHMDAETAALFPDHFERDLPGGWAATRLGSAIAPGGGDVQTGPFGSQLHAEDYVSEGIPVAMPTNIRNRRLEPSGIARVRPADADRLARHRLRVGDLVYSRRGDVEKHAIVGPEEEGWLCGTGCLRVRSAAPGGSGLSPHFLSLWLDDSASRAWIAARAVGATMPNLNTSILSEVPVLLPKQPVLDAFDRVVGPIDARIRAARAESGTLAALRDLLLPKLLSGELRVRDAEREVASAL